MVNTRMRRVLVGTVAVAGLIFYVFFFLLVTPDDVGGERDGIHYQMAEDDDEEVGRPHLVTVRAWSETGAPLTVALHHRQGSEGEFQALRMQRVGSGRTFAVEMPPLGEGERAFYYLEIRDPAGNAATVPETAPAAPLLHVRWEGHVERPILALHISLMIGALFFLVHGLHYAIRILAQRTRQTAILGKAHRAIAWGWLCFFVGGIPLGIYVSGTALGWHNAWGGWPLGIDITDTKTEVLAAYWGVALAVRADQIHPRLRARASDRVFGWLVAGGAALTVVVYAIPHSLFFQ